MTFRIGSVPYLNAKPMVDWFHSGDCDVDATVVYAPPSRLAEMLRSDEIDVANVSSFEGFRNPHLVIVPGISISSRGPVKSVRLFCKRPPADLRSVALDTSSLTSSALTRILLKERYGADPGYVDLPPNLAAMLERCDAGLIIGDLKLFDLMPGTRVLDLGEEWEKHTHLPFVYATWQAREDRVSEALADALTRARDWGVERLEPLAAKWAPRLELPLDRCLDYLENVMDYGLADDQLAGLDAFRQRCFTHGLIEHLEPARVFGAG